MSIASLYPSINPSLLLDFANSKVLDPRITFSRTTTATYYDGVTTAKAEENLVLYSQAFDNAAWAKNGITVTANSVAAPDGTTTAETIDDGTVNGYHEVTQGFAPASGTNYTISVYAKQPASNSRRYLNLSVWTGGSAYAAAIFDLQTQAISSGAQGSGYAIVSSSCTETYSGSGWFRCVLTVTSGSSATTYFSICTSNTATISSGNYGLITYTGSNQQLYIWGAQLEQRSSATAYTATTTQAITNYIPVLQTASAGQARFDHNPTTGESLGLLIEEARTNVATYSEDFGNAAWSKGGSVVAAPVVTTNQVIAPNGTLTGDQVDLPAVSGTNAFSLIYFPFTASALAYTGSFYLKGKNGGEQIWINFTKNGVNYTQTLCTLTTSWQRFSLSSTLTAGGDNFQIGVDLRDSAQSAKSAQTFFIWGAQLEAGSFATSYIPTVASSVTRNADAASMTGTNFSSWFNNGEGTLYAEASTSAANTAKRFAQIDSGAESNRIQIAAEASGTTKNFAVVTNSSTQAYTPVSASYPVKVGAGYKVNDFGASFNGGAIQTDTSGTVPALSVMRFGAASDASENMNGCLRKVSYYPAKATSAQIVGLTT